MNEPLTPEVLVEAWQTAIASVLGQLSQSSVAPAADDSPFAADDAVWIRFESDRPAAANFAFAVTTADAVRIADLLMGQAPNPERPYTPEDAEAVAETFRQFAGYVATEIKSRTGTDVAFRLAGADRPAWAAAAEARVASFAIGGAPLRIAIFAEPAMQGSAQTAAAAQRLPLPSVTSNNNLDLLLDVQLELTMRFGQRDMALQDILQLNQGSVVELESELHEPADLLIGGKVIARGEVVVVDGNYGLRVTEVVSPHHRIDALRAAF